MCSTWQVHKSPGWGDYDVARPWGPDALSTSTAEPAMDASRPSPHTFPEEARECAQAHTHREQRAPAIHHTSHSYIICLHASFSSLLASYSLIAHDEDKGQLGRRWCLL